MTDHEETFTEELADSNAISLEIANLIELQLMNFRDFALLLSYFR